ncbi:hypothetical protein INE84_02915 [Bacteroides uniformis]|nr:hypothetical protein INE84_02915 [Bacteroides uniformis]
MRNIVILNSLHFSYPLPILMRVSYNTLIVKQNTSDYYKYTKLNHHLYSAHDLIAKSSGVIVQNALMNALARRAFVINGILRSMAARRIL